MSKKSNKNRSKQTNNSSAKSRHTRISERRQERQAAQRNRIFTIGAVALGLVALFALIASAGGIEGLTSAVPEVASDRLQLDPVLGNPDAEVTLVEYGAYSCHSCQYFHNEGIIEDILDEYGDRIKFVFRDFPVITPAYDRMAAGIAQCALDQGQDQFWAFHDVLYRRASPSYSQDALIELGGEAGLDTAALRNCAEANTHLATVLHDLDRAQNQGFRGTPTFQVNGETLFSVDPTIIRQYLDQALASS